MPIILLFIGPPPWILIFATELGSFCYSLSVSCIDYLELVLIDSGSQSTKTQGSLPMYSVSVLSYLEFPIRMFVTCSIEPLLLRKSSVKVYKTIIWMTFLSTMFPTLFCTGNNDLYLLVVFFFALLFMKAPSGKGKRRSKQGSMAIVQGIISRQEAITRCFQISQICVCRTFSCIVFFLVYYTNVVKCIFQRSFKELDVLK